MKAAFTLFVLFIFCLLSGSFNTAKTNLVKINTSFGDIVIYLYDATPKHRDNFIKLTEEKYFDGTTFHRCIQNFVIQGGDPNSKDKDTLNDGDGGPGYMIDAEINPNIKHKYCAVGAAREGDDVNPLRKSSGSQFYIVIRNGGTPHLDGKYTVFGEVVAGMDVAEKIALVKKNAAGRPYADVPMKVEMLDNFSYDAAKLQTR
jgi:cyclophilin family peptidyl-prolyl cis-trans isomerase